MHKHQKILLKMENQQKYHDFNYEKSSCRESV